MDNKDKMDDQTVFSILEGLEYGVADEEGIADDSDTLTEGELDFLLSCTDEECDIYCTAEGYGII